MRLRPKSVLSRSAVDADIPIGECRKRVSSAIRLIGEVASLVSTEAS
jgi:hypothetical protein